MLQTKEQVLGLGGVSEDSETFPKAEIHIAGSVPHGVYEIVPDYVWGKFKGVELFLIGIVCHPDLPGAVSFEDIHYVPWDQKEGVPAGTIHAASLLGCRAFGSTVDSFNRKSHFSLEKEGAEKIIKQTEDNHASH